MYPCDRVCLNFDPDPNLKVMAAGDAAWFRHLHFRFACYLVSYTPNTALLRAVQDGTTALMAASVRGHKAAVDALLEHGASVDQQNLDGHTALMFAYNGRNQVTAKEK